MTLDLSLNAGFNTVCFVSTPSGDALRTKTKKTKTICDQNLNNYRTDTKIFTYIHGPQKIDFFFLNIYK